MMSSKKGFLFLILLVLLSAKIPVLRAEDPQIPEAASPSPAPVPEENRYGILVLPPQSEGISPSPSPEESSDAPAEMGTPVFEEEEEVTSRLSLNSQPD